MSTRTGAKRTVAFTTNSQGRSIALVPLANHPTPARIRRDDLEALQAAGWSANWTFNDSGNGSAYVKCRGGSSRGGHATVARLLMQAGRHEQVKYHDGDRTNLTRENLYTDTDPRSRKGRKAGAKQQQQQH